MSDDLLLVRGDARRLPLADESVQCIVTSPPYWGLRKYAGAQDLIWMPPRIVCETLERYPPGQRQCETHEHEWTNVAASGGKRNSAEEVAAAIKRAKERGYDVGGWGATQRSAEGKDRMAIEQSTCCLRCGAWRGAFGLEPTIEMYVAHTVEILRECRRVLRSDGVLFWNIGDSYAASSRGSGGPSAKQDSVRGSRYEPIRTNLGDLKPKDLCLIPDRVRLAAQADGWWVRSKIVWTKPNPMPESCRDRPTDAYEDIIMLTKSARYFWDGFAVREPATVESLEKIARDKPAGGKNAEFYMHGKKDAGNSCGLSPGGTRNLRNVWNFATQPYKGAHFATFPEELPRRCILAATSERGACAQCGSPWERVTRSIVHFEGGSGKALTDGGCRSWRGERTIPEETRLPGAKHGDNWEQRQSGDYDIRMGPVTDEQTIGWRPTCSCHGQRGRTVPCVCLDPFGGSGTTARVAVSLNRRGVSVDLAYHDLSDKRTRGVQRQLL
jgi:DNA modification methylase